MEYIASIILALGSFFGIVSEPEIGAYSYPTAAQMADTTGVPNGYVLAKASNGLLEYIAGGGGASASSSIIQIDGVQVNTGVPTLDFDGTDFSITESPTDDFDVTIASAIARDSELHDAVTFAGTGTYLSLSGQQITVDPITESDISDLTHYTSADFSSDLAATTSVGSITTLSNLLITEAQISDLTHTTDTNANTICTGSTTYLDGEGNCDNISSVYQPLDAGLTSISGLTTAADRMIYTTAADTYAVTTLSAFGRSLIDDAAASNARTTLGLGTLATLSTVNNSNWSGTDLSVANGGTGASTFTAGGVLIGNGTSAFTDTGVLANGTIIIGDGVTAPTTLAAFTAAAGTLKHESGGLEADVSAYTNGLYGQLSGATADIDTLSEFNTALGGSILSGLDAKLITGTAGGSGVCAEWNADGDLVAAASGLPCGAGGGSGSLATSTDQIGTGPVAEFSYVLTDFTIGGSSSTTSEFQFDKDGAQFIISSTTAAAGSITVDGAKIIDSTSGSATLDFIDVLGSTAEATIEAAVDTFPNEISFTNGFVSHASSTIDGPLHVTATMTVSSLVVEDTINTNATSSIFAPSGMIEMGSTTLETILFDFRTSNKFIVKSFSGVTDFVFSGMDIVVDSASQIISSIGGTRRIVAQPERELFSMTVASTSAAFIGSDVIPVGKYVDYAREITRIVCFVEGGTSKVINVSDGTNDTETTTCATSVTEDTDVATNDTFTADETWYAEFGATTGTVDYVTFTVYGYINE